MLLSLTEFIGRFHPLLVHLPIGILLMALLLQWLSGREKYRISQEVIKIVLLCGTFSALVSCITGFLLFATGDYEGDTVAWHMWMGIGVAFASLLLTARTLQKRVDVVHKITSFSLLMLILLTGHLGGSLTHGPDYLLAALQSNEDSIAAVKPIVNIQEATVYTDVIQPILQTKCYTCHSAKKQKGRLRMDSPEWLLKGGKNGEVIKAGNPEESELLKRLVLPLEAEEHMPPKAKPQLNEKQIQLIHWWISEGANFGKKVKDMVQPEKIKPVLLSLQSNRIQPKKPSNVPEAPVEEADEKALAALKKRGIVIVPVSQGSQYLSASFVTVPDAGDADLRLLLPVAKQLVWLKLGSTKITDASIPTLASFRNLTILHLDNTAITGSNFETLNSLTQLQTLNLTNTRVTASGLKSLTGLKKLQAIYLFGTNIGSVDIRQLSSLFPSVTIDTGGYRLPLLPGDTSDAKSIKK